MHFNKLLPVLILSLPCVSYAQDEDASIPSNGDETGVIQPINDDVQSGADAADDAQTVADAADDAQTGADAAQIGADAADASDTTAQGTEVAEEPEVSSFPGDHKIVIAPFPYDYVMHGRIVTSLGTLECDLYAGSHPLTVLNFVSLGRENYGWTDASGEMHQEAYYSELPLGSRVKGAYVTSSIRDEGTNFVLSDERCDVHQPVAGSVLMVQNQPGVASTQFALLARDIPQFRGMYIVFGQCGPLELIDKLTREDAVIERIEF